MCRFAVGILLTLFILSTNIHAYALNYNLVESEYNGWMETDDITLYNDNYISGSLKKIVDHENGCVYIYFQIYDNRLEDTSFDNAVISFDIMNDINEYHFSVNHSGFINTNTNEKQAIELAQNFELNSSFFTGFIGFELKNKQDRQLDSIIKCSYTCGHSEACTLFENVPIYMYVEPETTTVKSTSERTTKAKNSSGINSNKSKVNSTSAKSKATSDKSKKASSTKFSGSGKIYTTNNSSSSTETETTEKTSSGEVRSYNNTGTTEMSPSAKAILISAVVIALVGIIFIIVAVTSKAKKKQSDDSTDNNTDDNNEFETTNSQIKD
ncbi:MAG: hypothetical protein NC397_04205 [Clostridium sp.]|nr:hypothetical protein [Clostridium sp.]